MGAARSAASAAAPAAALLLLDAPPMEREVMGTGCAAAATDDAPHAWKLAAGAGAGAGAAMMGMEAMGAGAGAPMGRTPTAAAAPAADAEPTDLGMTTVGTDAGVYTLPAGTAPCVAGAPARMMGMDAVGADAGTCAGATTGAACARTAGAASPIGMVIGTAVRLPMMDLADAGAAADAAAVDAAGNPGGAPRPGGGAVREGAAMMPPFTSDAAKPAGVEMGTLEKLRCVVGTAATAGAGAGATTPPKGSRCGWMPEAAARPPAAVVAPNPGGTTGVRDTARLPIGDCTTPGMMVMPEETVWGAGAGTTTVGAAAAAVGKPPMGLMSEAMDSAEPAGAGIVVTGRAMLPPSVMGMVGGLAASPAAPPKPASSADVGAPPEGAGPDNSTDAALGAGAGAGAFSSSSSSWSGVAVSGRAAMADLGAAGRAAAGAGAATGLGAGAGTGAGAATGAGLATAAGAGTGAAAGAADAAAAAAARAEEGRGWKGVRK